MTDNNVELNASRQFTSWLYEQHISLAFSTYQAGKLFLIGVNNQGKMSVFERTFERCMGLHVSGSSIYMGTLYQIWKLENALEDGQQHNGYDAMYVPQKSSITGDIDIHDIALNGDGKVIFANTLFSCLGQESDTHSFQPIWKPDFVSKLAAEDRCHLNGLAIKDGNPAYVTAIAQSDVNEGWREHRQDGGVVIDVETSEVICEGLSMPHSPRWHNGKLWLHDSGNGYFGSVNMTTGKFEALCFCPGYLRGLAFHGDFAIVGISSPRNNKTFDGLALDDNLAQKKVSARCGLQIIDLRSGDIVHTLNLEGFVEEIYDVAVLPNIRRPMAIGFKSEEIRRTITMDE